MLVMRRRAGEGFFIGDGIEIQVLEVNGTRVKLGIVAPTSVAIVRREAQLTREENLIAARRMDPQWISAMLQKLGR
jgi:carbon storage regulator